jgi:hypothetical protein
MIGFIGTSVTISLNYKPYSAIADLHTFQFTVIHALGFSVSTNRLLATDLNTGIITSNHYEVFLSFLLQSPWNADPIFQSLYCMVLICTEISPRLTVSHLRLSLYRRGTDTHHRKHTSHDRQHCFVMSPRDLKVFFKKSGTKFSWTQFKIYTSPFQEALWLY